MEVNVKESEDNQSLMPNIDYNARSCSEIGAESNSFDKRDTMSGIQVQFEHQEQCIAESERTEIAESKDTNNQMSHRHRLSSSERSNTIGEDQSYVAPPKVNCQEKIIICVDASTDMEKLTFRSRSGDKLSPKQLTKKGLSIFLQSKCKIDKKHEFALMSLGEDSLWVRNFTSNPKEIIGALDDAVEADVYEMCNVGSVFDKILEKVMLPKVPGDTSILPPPYIIRLILIYGRSNCPLEFTKRESFNLLNSSPYFFLDVIFLHEPPSEENCCQKVFDSICDLDQTGQSYIFSVSRNQTKLFSHMAQLLAHPLQRPLQNEASYRIGSSIPLQDTE